jgi:hypothetical protein
MATEAINDIGFCFSILLYNNRVLVKLSKEICLSRIQTLSASVYSSCSFINNKIPD